MSFPKKLLVIAGIGLAFRLALTFALHHHAADDLQYWQLSEELARNGRYAFGPEPLPLTHSRLPGYPLFLHYVVHNAGLDRDANILRATRVNALLDVATAIGTALLAIELGLGESVALWAMALVLVSPGLICRSSYALGESLATCLSVYEILLGVWAWRTGSVRRFVAAGILAGAAQLVRLDALTTLPALTVWMSAPISFRRRLLGCAGFIFAFTLAFGGWPLRNQLRFGALHPEATEWPDQRGNPLRTSAYSWMRTWCSGRPGEPYFPMVVAFGAPLDVNRPGIVIPRMYSSEVERLAVVTAFEHYNREGMTAAVDAEFAALAQLRRAQHPFAYFVTLPLERALHLWTPTDGNMLRQEWAHPIVAWLEGLLLPGLMIAGAVIVWRRRLRIELGILLLPIFARTFLHAFATSFPDDRYLAEALPLILLLDAVALHALYAKARK